MIKMTHIFVACRNIGRSWLAPVAIGVATVSLGAMPSYGLDDANYGQCVVDLTASGLGTSAAAASCAGARFPGTLGACVVDVSQETGIGAEDALEGCERSRRPDEVATCTLDIHSALLEQPSVNALEHCSRSVLPERYGVCVVDLSYEAELAVDQALTQCVRAGYRPWTTAPRQ